METRKIIIAMTVVLVVAMCGPALGITYYVKTTGSPTGPGTTWATAFDTIQAGINATSATEVQVEEGTYTLSSQVNLNKALTLKGGYDSTTHARDVASNVTTVNGNDTVRCFYVTANGTIDGFTITQGYASGTGDGAGVYIYGTNAATINNCMVSDCSASDDGGGIWNNDGASTVSDCTLSGNVAGSDGAGIWNDDGALTVSGCVLSGNVAGSWGAGMSNDAGAIKVLDCVFSGNTADGAGGGLFNDEGAITVDDSVFYDNYAGYEGGGLHNYGEATGYITSCVFAQNEADDWGGGISNDEAGGYGSGTVYVINCTFFENLADTGGAIFNDEETNCAMYNCILWDNTATSSGSEIYNDCRMDAMVVGDCTIEGGLNGSKCDGCDSTDDGGNDDDDPEFEDDDDLIGSDDEWGTCDDGLNLDSGSPCIDEGDEDWADEDYDGKDIKGSDRDLDSDPDQGAYEYDSGC